jgi:hypothetical protein
MTSFINLLANDIWSDADITRRTEAMVRSEFSLEAETILNRKVAGISLNQYTPTPEDLAEMARFKEVVDAAQAAGVAARADMALLSETLVYEVAKKRLAQTTLQDAWDRLQLPEVEPIVDEETDEVINQAEVDQDKAERAAAQQIVQPHLITIPSTEVDGESQTILDPASVAQDEAERAAAQAVIDSAPQEVRDLFEARREPVVIDSAPEEVLDLAGNPPAE